MCLAEDDLAGARAAIDEALTRGAATPEPLLLAAAVYAQQGDLDQAREKITAALELAGEDPHAHNALGNLLRLEGDLEQAIASYQRALEIDPNFAAAWSNCALCLQELGRHPAARHAYEQAIAADPRDPTAQANFASLLFESGEFDQAMVLSAATLHAHPRAAHAHLVKAIGLLRRGHYAEGWPEYEWRDRYAGRGVPETRAYPEWDGSALDTGALLVRAEQGLGDQIMFASCFGDLSARAHRIVIECDPRLTTLFARSFPEIRFYPQRKRDTEPWERDGIHPAAMTWMGSLPLRFRKRPEDFPQASRYLVADAAETTAWTQRLSALGPGLRIGISWRGGVPTTRRTARSIALRDWRPVLCLPGIHVVSLQYGDCRTEIADLTREHDVRIHHWEHAISDYDETAALVRALDIVISVQTSVVHLAGALGTPVWVLVPQVAEWRYGETGDSMPWYRSARLFRQSGVGWSAALERVRAALASISAGTRPERT